MVRMRRRRRASRGLITSFVVGQLPAPMRFALESRLHGILMVILLAALVGSGMISVQWEEAGPTVEFDRQRARELGSQVVERWRSPAETDDDDPEDAWSDEPWGQPLTELALQRWLERSRASRDSAPSGEPLSSDGAAPLPRQAWEDRKVTRTGPPLNSSSSTPTMSR
jgi:hypothetical protein